MKKNRTRVGAFLLAMVMMFGMLPLNSMAAFVGSETGSEIVNPPGGSYGVKRRSYGPFFGCPTHRNRKNVRFLLDKIEHL